MVDKQLHKLLNYINLALIILPLSSGLNAGISLTFLKGATIAFNETGFGGYTLYIYAFIGLFSGQMELYILNRAMNLFEQV